ncbi:MAG TPA: HD domain-containing protein [Pontiellaceae bacterium]|nr:HD domain-containing protein [Pontiellaceae bacterium]
MNRPEHTALNILKQIRKADFTAFFAGGSVRDKLLGRTAKDYDIATSATPDQIEALFPKTVAVGKAFGVIIVVQDGTETEVATFRADGGYQDGRRPDTVEFCGAEEDAKRRDFTVNGMFYDPLDDRIIDYVGGQEDLEKKIIRAIGDPDRRFAEDHLRILRAVRFAHTLGFAIEPATRAAIRRHAPDLVKISAERIENEFSRTLTESLRPGDALRELVDLGLMEFIIPEILPMIGQEQPPEFHPEGDVFEHTVLMLNLMNQQTEMPASQIVEQAFQPAHPFRPVEQTAALHTSRRRLPHWEQDSRIYFITFRLADSIAQEKLNQWQEELEIWKKQQPDPASEETERERARLYHERQEKWLDKGYGSCILKNPEISAIVEQTLRHFDGERYRLGDYVIMPNHVHLIIEPAAGQPLSGIMQSWKGYSAREINKVTGSKGALWMDESFDHIIRSEESLEKFTDYMRQNPVQAHLASTGFRAGTGSLSDIRQAGKPASHGEPPFPPVHSSNFKKLLAYTALLHDVGKPATAFMGADRLRFHGHERKSAEMAEEILRRLKLPVKEIRRIVTAIDGHMRFKDVQKMNKSTLRKLMGAETFELELELHRIDCAGSHGLLDNYDFLLKKADEMKNEPILPERWITGKDLREIGIASGPHMGELLQLAYDAQLEGRFPDRETLLAWLKTQL